ncbi:hypothetical protein EUTSA_v10022025mg, partial [Eutrema salsugineum]
MRGVIPNYHHSYTFFFFVVFVNLFSHVFSINTLSSTESLTISSNRTVVSPGDVFELGFFKTTRSSSRDGDRWYLGIWYKKTTERTYVWVANRDNPVSNPNATLKISDANLVLLDQSDTLIWSTNLTRAVKSPVVAELLGNGNLVLRDSKTKDDPNQFLWQSFDFPVDTLLPEMKIGWGLRTGHNRFLKSWRSPNDPSSGDYSFKLETGGLPEFYLKKGAFKVYRTGPWNGIRFSGIPKMQQGSYIVDNFIEKREEVAYTFRVTTTNHSFNSRITLSSNGLLQIYTWNPTAPEPNMFLFFPSDDCDLYSVCGSYSYCDMKTSPVCNCIGGFVPKNVTAWGLGDASDGCVRRTPLSCGRGDRFLRMEKMKLPETSRVNVDVGIELKE